MADAFGVGFDLDLDDDEDLLLEEVASLRCLASATEDTLWAVGAYDRDSDAYDAHCQCTTTKRLGLISCFNTCANRLMRIIVPLPRGGTVPVAGTRTEVKFLSILSVYNVL